MYLYLKIIAKYLCKKRKSDLTLQFKEFCLSLSASLITGYSLENSIRETYKEMVQLYGNNSYICKELKVIDSKLKLSITIERCFEEFASRCNVEEIKLFSEIVKIAKRTGGDIIEIVKDAADSISQKIEVEREIKIIINSKKQEQMIMNFIPLIMIIYVNSTSPDMMSILYSGILGRIIMTVCLGFYIFAVYLGNKFSDIKM
ncbi:MAG: type II secretion system protein F [Lachnospiraceae bacterium]|nr:type II secretion system protein F [Lachnospiraceae bacterium]